MNGPVRGEARETVAEVLVVGEAVWAAQVWQDDEVPEEEGRGRHQVDSPEEEGEEDLKSEDEQMVVLVLRGRKVVHHCEQCEEGQDGRAPDVGVGQDVVLKSLPLVLD